MHNGQQINQIYSKNVLYQSKYNNIYCQINETSIIFTNLHIKLHINVLTWLVASLSHFQIQKTDGIHNVMITTNEPEN